ncbi:MAG: hypothetical protein L0Y44_02355 [Phycisphaerales bacterium]|nr:hypothetical protein [Phycisphaerales bacterium]MCI0629477.1 hypothetical protein [Phycisphaerales bacterium]MCI0674753.1 hypothetical protein [Phycisphaerales bacterium]
MLTDSNAQCSPEYGFAESHWDIIREYARNAKLVIIFRAGKAASIRWIDKGYPAKPMTLGGDNLKAS